MLKTFYWILPFISIFSFSTNFDHEFHVSKVDVVYNDKSGSIEITSHIFIDDFEFALQQAGIDSLYLCTKKEKDNAEEVIADYLNEHIIVEIDGEKKAMTYLGKEMSEDLAAMWCYLEIEEVTPRQSMQVECSILMESFDDQTNMIKLERSKTNREFFMFQKDNIQGKLIVK